MPPRCAQVDVWVPAQVAADGLPKGGLFTTHNGLPPDASQRRNFRLNNLTGLLAFRATTDPRVEALLRRRPVAVLNLGDLDYPRPHDLRARPWLSAARRPRGNPPQTRPSLGLSTRRLPAASPRPRPLSESPRVGPAASPRPRPLGASPKFRRDIYSQRNLRFTRRTTTFGDRPQVPVFTTNAPDQIATDPALRVAPAARRSDVAFVSGRRSRRVSTELRRRGRGVAATPTLSMSHQSISPPRRYVGERLVGTSANASAPAQVRVVPQGVKSSFVAALTGAEALRDRRDLFMCCCMTERMGRASRAALLKKDGLCQDFVKGATVDLPTYVARLTSASVVCCAVTNRWVKFGLDFARILRGCSGSRRLHLKRFSENWLPHRWSGRRTDTACGTTATSRRCTRARAFVKAGSGDAAAATGIFCGGAARRRRGN